MQCIVQSITEHSKCTETSKLYRNITNDKRSILDVRKAIFRSNLNENSTMALIRKELQHRKIHGSWHRVRSGKQSKLIKLVI